MAGIGFELKKLYGKDQGITRTLGAMGYSMVTTIGPTLLIVGVLVATNILMTVWGVSETEKNTLAGCMLYCFVLGLIVSAIFDTGLSRYVSDCIFSEIEERVLPAMQGFTIILALLYGVLGAVFALLLYFVSGLDAYYVLMVYLLLMGVGLTFGLSVFITAIKAYRRITMAYLGGSAVIIVLSLFCYFMLHMPTGHSIITGFAVGFLLVAAQMFVFLHMAFPESDKSYFRFLSSLRENKLLLVSGLFYVLGMYVHNMVFWGSSDLQVVVAKIIVCAPSYDMASFVAMLTSITLVVIFVVRVETSFYTQYKGYCEAVISKNFSNIQLAREKMSRTLINEVYFVSEFQLIITIVVMSLCITFLPLVGIAGITLDIYPILALGYYTVYTMRLLMVFLYYFDDQIGAAVTGVLFFVLTLGGTLLTYRLGIAYYGLGLVFSGAISWIIAFLRLRYMLKRVDYKMFCNTGR